MSVSTINNNMAQLYTQQKPATATLQQQKDQAIATTPAAADSVKISEQARVLLQQEQAVTTLGNGEGIEPPKTVAGNGEGIEPPKT